MARNAGRSQTAWTVGILGSLAVTLTFFVLPESLPMAVPALVLLVPVCVASAMAGWKVGAGTALLGGLAYTIAFVPPIGGVPLEWTEDLYVLGAFLLVAAVVGLIAGRQDRAPSDAALDADRAMLLRSVSHDLRSPLSTIQTVSSDLVDGTGYDESTRQELIEIVANEATRLNRIVGNLLSISRVQAGTFEPALEATSLGALVVTAVDRLDSPAMPRLVVDVADDLPDVLADPVQVDQVLANLLENALRHAPADSSVRIAAERHGGEVTVTVADDGPGFSPEALDAVHHGVPPRRGPGRSGSGLGLTVCRAIVLAHDGRIWAETPARGALVRFTLPVATTD